MEERLQNEIHDMSEKIFALQAKTEHLTNGQRYAAINEILLALSKKVRFAYSLDGGGSAETVVDRTQINTIYEGTYGRKVPTLIYFDQR